MANQRDSWQAEKRSAYLYRKLAENTRGHEQVLFNQLANEADEQADLWARSLLSAGDQTPLALTLDLRTRFVAFLVRWFSPSQLATVLASMKIRGMSLYFAPSEEKHPIPQSIEEVGARHKLSHANNLRAAVFGVNDGLVSNASLILGMIGAHSEPATVMLAGTAGLLAGAFSMAAGEFVSVRSQRELFEYQIELEREELEMYPEAETAELALIYQARGLNKDHAEKLAKALMENPTHALDTLARDELGINPNDLVSPWGAAISSFLSFIFGAFLPMIPYLISKNTHHLPGVILITAFALFAIGLSISLFTGRNAWKGGVRMLLIGLCAGAVTYLIGHSLSVIL
ncbi:MAG: VIT1/CCC1 transporter family protein [Gammaproteobacteria bacterium]|nr:VIT1/CCC1 transporter family protein [Gammaproteobacteria bacterium]